MPASLLMVLATLLFATMGVCVKLASDEYGAGEIVFYRGLVGVLVIAAMSRWQGQSLRTAVPGMHFWRSLSGVLALSLWFYSIGKLPLATAMTLNYMSSVWMALFLIGGGVLMGSARVDPRLVAAVLLGFCGVALVLRPTMDEQQLWYGLAGLLSGMLSALAYLQVTSLGRAGEPEYRIVFYFSLGGIAAGALTTLATGDWHGHSLRGSALLLAVGLLATAAQLSMTRAYSRGKTLVNASLQYLGIVFSFLYGALLFGDALTPSALLGMCLIIVAGLAATLLRSRSTPADSQHSTLES
ncbi:DMT family transporter [Roseateles toxinivorans]|uniref:S-adenosylmethionine uptake transporter n=1 Tax=Roseateles toxinivorans TaxID=270368 RepID=A0A4R6QJK8_9BURK|nr:DMT family transporter [Roseateles toxinivorans]TDP63176.1 S-adenosylmethionine uptake transporter [Roseateles toxinivorans]